MDDPRLADRILDYLAWLTHDRGASVGTVRSYTSDLRLFQASLPQGARLSSVTQLTIRAWLTAQQQAGCTTSTRARRLRTLRGFGTWAVAEGHLTASPAHRLRVPHATHALPRVFTDAEVRQLLDAMARAADPSARRDQAVLEMLAGTGLRRSELVALNVGDCSLEGRWIQVRHGKGDKARMVPISTRIVATLTALLDPAAPTDAPVFVSCRGHRLRAADVARIVKTRGRAAGLTGRLHCHAYRHYYVTTLLSHGEDIRAVQVLAGHASIVTTQRYDHVAPGRLAASAAKHPLFAA